MRPWRFTSHTLRQVRVPEVPQIRSVSRLRHRSRRAQHLIWCCGVMSLVEFSNQIRKRGKPEAGAFPSVRLQRRRPPTSSHAHVSETETIHITDNPSKNQSSRSSWPSAALCRDAPGKQLSTLLDVLDTALGMTAAISVEEQGPPTFVGTAVVGHFRAWRRQKVIFRIGGEPAICAPGVAEQDAKSEETVIECRPKNSSPSMGLVENMNKELCGLVRCFRIYLREKGKMEITTESPLLPWLVGHCVWRSWAVAP